MRHLVYRLVTEDSGRSSLQATARRTWHPMVVVPREACSFQLVPCPGVAWHERREFARLQLLRLAPFVRTGANAVFRRGHLMVWLWDLGEVQTALRDQGRQLSEVRLVAETLLTALPASEGACTVACQGGFDHLELSQGLILRSRWEPGVGRRPPSPELLRKPWGRDLLAPAWGTSGSRGAFLGRVPLLASWSLAALSAAYLAYWGGAWLNLQHQLEARAAMPKGEAIDLAAIERLSRSEREDLAWLRHYEQASSSLSVAALFDALERPLESHRLVLKELELRNTELRLALASVGNEIDLPAVLQALDAVPGIQNVQLRQNPDPLQATYTMKGSGFMEPVLGRRGER